MALHFFEPIRRSVTTLIRRTFSYGSVLVLFSLLAGWEAGAESAASRRVRFREPHEREYLVHPADQAPGSTWLRLWPDNGSINAMETGNRVVLKLEPGQSLADLQTNAHLLLARTINSNLFILQAVDSWSALDAAENLAGMAGVAASYPVMRRPVSRRDVLAPMPDDTYIGEQWHLENRATNGMSAGVDLNIRAAWPVAAGQGVCVAVADEGFQLDHPDLWTRTNGAPHYNFFEGVADGGPFSADAAHATAVAGLIAAEANNHVGVAGVAPQATLASWVIWGYSAFLSESIASDEQLMDMYQYALDKVAVQNHSWGNASAYQMAVDALSDSGIEKAVKHGRGGLGVVLVRAGGNERSTANNLNNVNDDGFASDPRVIAVGAIRTDGRACSYSNPGASLLVSAPSGDTLDTNGDNEPDAYDPMAPNVLTTDLTGAAGYSSGIGERADYAEFNGTSASAPQIAGVAALILSANTNLGYRDVQHILVQSARHYDLADADLRTNGAGFQFSHNLGFGVPDAGFAVKLAKSWTNRPLSQQAAITNTTRQNIPDDALRVICEADGLANSLSNLHCLPSRGLHPDDPNPALPLVYVGTANEDLTVDLHGKVALIQRGVSYFRDKIDRAFRAGASAAIVFNNTGITNLVTMAATDYAAIPAVFIGQRDGEALRDWIADHPETTARFLLTPAVYRFAVNDTLLCEHVGVHLKTNHKSRGDVRVTLVSPMGSRSILQNINTDSSAGPTDWTYWSTQHFFESSAGEWRLEVSDERNTVVRTGLFTTAPATGSVTYAELKIQGIRIVDSDHDGLDDNWELEHFGSLEFGPKDDPDGDGFNNAREQGMNTDPWQPNQVFKLDFAQLKPGFWRLSWPARRDATYRVLGRSNLSQPWDILGTVTGKFPVAEFVVPEAGGDKFYLVRRLEAP